MFSLWPLHWHEDKRITSRHWTVTYLCGWELEVEHHTSSSFVFILLIFLPLSIFVQDSFQTCLFESKCAKLSQFSKPIIWYNIIWYWNRVNLTDLTRVTRQTDNWWLVADVLVCTHVRTVHVNLAGCQRRLRVVKMTCGVKWMACVCRWWKNSNKRSSVWGRTRTYTHMQTPYLPALSPAHTPLMFQGVKKMEKHLQPNHFRSFQRFLFMCAESVRAKVSSPALEDWPHALGNPTLLEVIRCQRE